MSNWLGFSLTPHLRIDEGFGTTAGRIDDDDDDLDQNQNQNQPTTYNNNISSSSTAAAHHHHHHHHHHQNIPVMPLRSDGSLCVLDPFRHHPPDWRYESNMDVGGGSASEEGPKLEDFLGSCYSNSPSDHHNNGINVNVDLVSDMEAAGGEDLGINTSSLNNYQYFIENNNNNNPNPNHHLMMMSDHHVQGFDHESETSSSVGFKSWLSQAAAAPFCDMKSGSTSSNHHQVTNFQSLSLSMSSNPTSHNSHQNGSLMVSPPPPTATAAAATMISPLMQQVVVDNSKKRVGAKSLGRDPAAAAAPRKSIDTFGQRTSQYRGVTRHRWTGRYEAHLWDNSCRKEGQTRKGRQACAVYLGGYDKEEKAARAYDLAALKYWGPTTHINFPLSSYENELEEMKHMTRQEFVANLRRKSSGFSRGASVYRGVTRHHQHGRWQARIGRVAGNKDLYLGTFSTQEEAAEAYDIAAIKFRGTSAVTNFGISRYDVKRICSSSTLIASDLAKRNSLRDGAPMALDDCASSKSPPQPPVLAITWSEAADELTDMIWSGKGNKHDQQQQQNFDNNDTTLVGSSSRNSSSSESLKCSVGLGNEFGISGGDLPPHQGYFSFQGPKYEDENENNQSGNGSSNRDMGGLDLASQVPMFALWNE